MKDKDIRKILIKHLEDDSKIIGIREEMPVGGTRIDVTAFYKDKILGYEIKSDHDSLRLLKGQVKWYDTICDYSYLVTTKKHAYKSLDIVPSRWGLLTCDSGSELRILHEPLQNFGVELKVVVGQNWKSELIHVLRTKGIKDYSKLDKREIVQLSINSIAIDELKRITIQNIKEKRF